VVQETEKDVKFAASKVKRVTGGDRLSARFMGQDWMDFEPTHTLIMCSNHKPEADSDDEAFWRRAQLAEFGVVVPDNEVDIELTAKLRAEADGVLTWIVQGAFEWLDLGLCPPDAVLDHTKEYRKSEDTIQAFMDECCAICGDAKVASSRLYGRYRDWCKDCGEKPLATRFFGPQLEAKGFQKKKTKTGMVYFGIGLHAAEYDNEERYP
jgi:putative DNA primase/helicase